MTFRYATGSVFSVQGGLLVHSCNAADVWGGGPGAVAMTMRVLYPDAYASYAAFCSGPPTLVGRAHLWISPLGHGVYGVGSLIVSAGFGTRRDPPNSILFATTCALDELIRDALALGYRDFHSPRINAGLFRVPWEQTEAVLKAAVAKYNVEWTVWTP